MDMDPDEQGHYPLHACEGIMMRIGSNGSPFQLQLRTGAAASPAALLRGSWGSAWGDFGGQPGPEGCSPMGAKRVCEDLFDAQDMQSGCTITGVACVASAWLASGCCCLASRSRFQMRLCNVYQPV